MSFFEAPAEPEPVLDQMVLELLSSRLVQYDWEVAIERAEMLKHDFSRLQDAMLDVGSSEWRSWTSQELEPKEVEQIVQRLAHLDRSAAWSMAYALWSVVSEYYGCLIDDEKQLGHLIVRHKLACEEAASQPDDDLYKRHVFEHRHNFGHQMQEP